MSFFVKILGANSATPVYGRHPTSQLVRVENNDFLIDCGEGTQMQMHHYRVKTGRLDHLFISHLHGDHYFGLMGLLNTLQLNGRKKDLHIYGPPGLDEIIIVHLKHARSSLKFKLKFNPLVYDHQTTILETQSLRIDCFPLYHNIPCYGFLFQEKPKLRKINKAVLPGNLSREQLVALKAGYDLYDQAGNLLYENYSLTLPPKKSRSYAYCSDTRYHDSLIDIVRDVDMLYHEATFMEEDRDKANETDHSTTREAGLVAKKAGVNQLIIGHYSSRYRELEPMLKETREVFPETEIAQEGRIFNIPE